MEITKTDRVQCPQCKQRSPLHQMETRKISRRGRNPHTGKREMQYQFLEFCKNTPCAARYQQGAFG